MTEVGFLVTENQREEAFAVGQEKFNDEFFFEAHEKWEDLWKKESGTNKSFLQGLIQFAGFFVNFKKKNFSGALSLLTSSQKNIFNPNSPKAATYRKVDLEPIAAAIDYNLGILANPDEENLDEMDFKALLIPKIF